MVNNAEGKIVKTILNNRGNTEENFFNSSMNKDNDYDLKLLISDFYTNSKSKSSNTYNYI